MMGCFHCVAQKVRSLVPHETLHDLPLTGNCSVLLPEVMALTNISVPESNHRKNLNRHYELELTNKKVV